MGGRLTYALHYSLVLRVSACRINFRELLGEDIESQQGAHDTLVVTEKKEASPAGDADHATKGCAGKAHVLATIPLRAAGRRRLLAAEA